MTNSLWSLSNADPHSMSLPFSFPESWLLIWFLKHLLLLGPPVSPLHWNYQLKTGWSHQWTRSWRKWFFFPKCINRKIVHQLRVDLSWIPPLYASLLTGQFFWNPASTVNVFDSSLSVSSPKIGTLQPYSLPWDFTIILPLLLQYSVSLRGDYMTVIFRASSHLSCSQHLVQSQIATVTNDHWKEKRPWLSRRVYLCM